MPPMVRHGDSATEGNRVSIGFQKEAAVRCWRQTVEHCGFQEQELADAAGVSKGYFSKVSSGQQGDLLGLIFQVGEKLPAVRRDFVSRLAEQEQIDLVSHAAEQAALAAIRLIRVVRGRTRPAKAQLNARGERVA